MPIVSINEIKFDDDTNVFGKDTDTFERIKLAESSGNPRAINRNKNGTYDSGLYQINSIHIPELQKQGIIQKPSDLFDPNINTKAASFLYQRDGLKPWSASRDKWDNTKNSNIIPIDQIVFDDEQPKPQAQTKTPETPQKPTMFGQIKADLSKRAENIRNIERYAKEGTDWERMKRSPGYAIKEFAQMAGGVNDVIAPILGEVISRGTGYHHIPEKQREAIKESIIQSKPVQAIGKGMQYAEEKFPVASQMAEDFLNISSLLPTGAVASRGTGTVAGMAGRRIKKSVFNDVVNYVKKDANKLSTSALTDLGAEGKLKGGGKFFKREFKTTPEDIETASLVSDVVNPNGNPYKNIDRINNKISKRSYEVDKVVLNKDANSIFIGENKQELLDYLENIKSKSTKVYGSDESLHKSYDSVINLFKEELAKQPNNLSGVYNARKRLGVEIRKKFGDPNRLARDAKDNARLLAEQDIYEAIPNFISDTLPEGNQFKRLLKDEALMYRAKRNISFNAAPTIAKTLGEKISSFIHQHPFAAFAALGGTGFATGLITSPTVMGGLAAYGTYKVGKTVITNKMVRNSMAKILTKMEKVLTGSEKAEIRQFIKRLDESEAVRGRKALPPGRPEEGFSGGPAIPIEKTPMRGTETGRMGIPPEGIPTEFQKALPSMGTPDWQPYRGPTYEDWNMAVYDNIRKKSIYD